MNLGIGNMFLLPLQTLLLTWMCLLPLSWGNAHPQPYLRAITRELGDNVTRKGNLGYCERGCSTDDDVSGKRRIFMV